MKNRSIKYNMSGETYFIEKNQIYALSSSESHLNFRYIGFTSQSLIKRYRQHLEFSRKDYKEDYFSYKNNWIRKELQNNNKIIITFLCDCGINNDLNGTIEDIIINLYKGFGFKLTNSKSGGKKGRLSQSVKEKISQSLKGKKITKEQYDKMLKFNASPVNQYNIDGKFIKTWNTILEAANAYKKHPSGIGKAIKLKTKCAGYQWRYLIDKNSCDNIESWEYKKTNFKKINQYDKSGKYLTTYSSISEAAKINNIKYISNISKIANTKKRFCNGFSWRFLSEEFPVGKDIFLEKK